jgi:5-methylcytosine-specific restriction endonuclease McrA
MGKKLLTTPRSKVRASLRQLWLRSRERAAALKRDGYTCQRCNRKQSKAKGKEFDVQVHHKNGVVNWEQVIDYIMASLLCGPEHLETLCKGCHDIEGKR